MNPFHYSLYQSKSVLDVAFSLDNLDVQGPEFRQHWGLRLSNKIKISAINGTNYSITIPVNGDLPAVSAYERCHPISSSIDADCIHPTTAVQFVLSTFVHSDDDEMQP